MRTNLIAVFTLVLVASAGTARACDSCGCQGDHKHDIVDTALDNEDFSTLVAAVKAAGLAETLKGDGPFTVFAPTNAAFEKLPAGTVEGLLKPEAKDQLVAILTYHVVPQKVLAADVTGLTAAPTVNGKDAPISLEDGSVIVAGATVTATDIECTNGVIHVIDAVMIP